MTPDELKAMIGQYDGLAIRSATKVTHEIIDAATNLKVIGRAGIGVDNVDIPYASVEGRGGDEHPVRQLDHHRRARDLADVGARPPAPRGRPPRPRPANGRRTDFMGVEVTGKTLGLIGAGNIGSIVADRAQGLRMKVVAYDPVPDRGARGRDWGSKRSISTSW